MWFTRWPRIGIRAPAGQFPYPCTGRHPVFNFTWGPVALAAVRSLVEWVHACPNDFALLAARDFYASSQFPALALPRASHYTSPLRVARPRFALREARV